MTRHNAVVVPIHPLRPDLPELEVLLYGPTVRDMGMVPDGSALVRSGVRRAGLDPDHFVASRFEIYR